MFLHRLFREWTGAVLSLHNSFWHWYRAGFLSAMASNVTFQSRNVLSKKLMVKKEVHTFSFLPFCINELWTHSAWIECMLLYWILTLFPSPIWRNHAKRWESTIWRHCKYTDNPWVYVDVAHLSEGRSCNVLKVVVRFSIYLGLLKWRMPFAIHFA